MWTNIYQKSQQNKLSRDSVVYMPKKISAKKIFLLIFIASFFLFLLWRSQYGIILFGDINFFLQKKSQLINEFYVWQNINFGAPLAFPQTLYILLYKTLSYFLPINFVSHLYYYGLYFFLALSIIYLVHKINKSAEFIDYLILIIFAITCPLVYPVAIIGGIEEMYSLVFVNLAIGYLFNFKNSKAIYLKDLFFIFIILLLGNVYLQTMILFYVILFLYLIIYSSKYLLTNIIKIIKIGIFWLGLNFFWLVLPIYHMLFGSNLNNLINYDPVTEGVEMVRQIGRTNQLFHPFVFYNNLPLVKSLYWGNYYILIIQLFFFCLAIFCNFIIKNNKENVALNRLKQFLLATILIFYLFSLGPKIRWENIFMFFWNHVPIFSSFRSIFKFLFPIYFSLIILIIFSLDSLKKIRIFKYLILIWLLPSLLVFFRQSSLQRMNEYKIPEYYNKIEAYFNKGVAGYIKIIPDQSWYSIFNWKPNGTDSVNILPYYIKDSVLYNFATHASKDPKSKLNDTLNELLLACDSSQFGRLNTEKILNAYSIQKVVLQKDVQLRLANHFCIDRLKSLSFLALHEKFGSLEIFNNDSNDFVPIFYAATNLILTNQDSTTFPYIVSETNYATKSVVLFKNQNSDFMNFTDNTKFNEANLPSINFKKINSTKYKVLIRNAKDSFLLVFNQSFHKDWRLYLINNFEIAEERHLLVNGYANGWFIDPKKICSLPKHACSKSLDNGFDLEITAEYFPQKIFIVGAFISILSAIIILFLIFKYNYFVT